MNVTINIEMKIPRSVECPPQYASSNGALRITFNVTKQYEE